MRARFRIAMALIVLGPLAALGWLGAELAERERQAERQRRQQALDERLAAIGGVSGDLLSRIEIDLLGLGSLAAMEPAQLRDLNRSNGRVRQFFVVAPSGDMLFPSPDGALTESEYLFLQRVRSVWLDWSFFGNGAPETPPQAKATPPGKAHGWEAWYWGGGLRLTFWWRDAAGSVSGAELSRARLIGNLIAALPDTNALSPAPLQERIVLADANGGVLYQWGAYEPGPGEPPRAQQTLAAPLGAWSLRLYAPTPEDGPGGSAVALYLSLGAFGATFLAAAGFAYWESARTWREARQRITFANQVSHELKTPLTNIRMYAEMLEDELEERDETAQRRLGVITSESRRLSRLIDNILTFNRQQRSDMELRPAPVELDSVVAETAETFRPSLTAKGIELDIRTEAPGTAIAGQAALEQIVVNLLSNAEKYARGASRVEVATYRKGDAYHLVAADDGPGVSRRDRRRIFKAFYRVSDKLTDGVAGTGIGLTIARTLARLHGGDVTAEPAAHGARFHVELRAPLDRGDTPQ